MNPPPESGIGVATMQRYVVILAFFLAACTSTWEQHRQAMVKHEIAGEHEWAVDEARWLVDNAFRYAPASQRTQRHEAGRLLRLSRLQATAGDTTGALSTLRQVLMVEPEAADVVARRIADLPLDEAARQQVQEEFSWNLAALAPQERLTPPSGGSSGGKCWSYEVQEVRVQRQRTITLGGRTEHQVTYDARPWTYDAEAQRWALAGPWVGAAGTEMEHADGPPRARYRALIRAQRQFYADERVPPCHRAGWQGPFDEDRGRVFVATELPGL
jgi:hypothetical protein